MCVDVAAYRGFCLLAFGMCIRVIVLKIMKIAAIKKNRDEKGSRAEFFGSNPHSNGDLFSRSSLIFFEINVASTIIADDNRMVIVAVVIIISIINLFYTNFLIGSLIQGSHIPSSTITRMHIPNVSKQNP
jgi:hypothetical protein